MTIAVDDATCSSAKRALQKYTHIHTSMSHVSLSCSLSFYKQYKNLIDLLVQFRTDLGSIPCCCCKYLGGSGWKRWGVGSKGAYVGLPINWWAAGWNGEWGGKWWDDLRSLEGLFLLYITAWSGLSLSVSSFRFNRCVWASSSAMSPSCSSLTALSSPEVSDSLKWSCTSNSCHGDSVTDTTNLMGWMREVNIIVLQIIWIISIVYWRNRIIVSRREQLCRLNK